MNAFDGERIREALTTERFGRELVYLPRVGSTNDVAKDLAAKGGPEGAVVLADEQTAGRGRMGRRWMAPPGSCILCSIVFRPRLPLARVQQLTMLCSLAAADAVEGIAGLQVWLKWPNDLIVEPEAWRKLAGVLTETGVVKEQVSFAVVGIGINVNVPAEALPGLAPDATSILAETGRWTDRVALLAALLTGAEWRYQALLAGESPHQEWTARLATLDRPVKVITLGGVLSGVAESVDESGALLLRTADGELHRFLAGDVTLDRP